MRDMGSEYFIILNSVQHPRIDSLPSARAMLPRRQRISWVRSALGAADAEPRSAWRLDDRRAL